MHCISALRRPAPSAPRPTASPPPPPRCRRFAAAPPPLAENAHYGVEFEGIAKWYELGLVGMGYIKDKLGVAAIDVLVLGLGGVVKKEDEKVGEEPDKYPARTLAVIEVQRD